MFLRLSNPSPSNAVALDDLGYSIPGGATNYVISDQFAIDELVSSTSLTSAINTGALKAEIFSKGAWLAIVSANYDPSNLYAAYENVYEISKTTNNDELVKTLDTSLHKHDNMYFTEVELMSKTPAAPGAAKIGLNSVPLTNLNPVGPTTTTQEFAETVDKAFHDLVNLDTAYDNDSDGILSVDGTNKPLNIQSNNSNEIAVSRKAGTDIQDMIRFKVGGNEVVIGAAAVGALQALLTRIKGNLYVEGDISFSGKITDTTVDNMNVQNERITLRDGATVGADAKIAVERGSTGNDAVLKWAETSARWMAGVEGAEKTVALLETDEVVSGVYEMNGGSVNPSLYLTNVASAPTSKLGTATQFGVKLIDGLVCVYDKTNSRNKFLSVNRVYSTFTGRDSSTNTNEYARTSAGFVSNLSGFRLMRNATLVGISVQNVGNQTWTARVRKNGNSTNLASLAVSNASGAQDVTTNIDFVAGDSVSGYIEGSNVNRPVIILEFAYRF